MRTNAYLACLAALLAIPTVTTLVGEGGSFTVYENVPLLFEGFSPEKVALIQVSKVKLDEAGKPVEQNGQPQREALLLRKTSDGWVIGQGEIAGAPVTKNPDVIAENILQHLESIRRDDEALIATKADDETLAKYELDDQHGVLIECVDSNNAPVAQLVKGRNATQAAGGGESLRGVFVRRMDRKDVILYERDYWNLTLDTTNWIERMVIPRTVAGELVGFEIGNAQGRVAFKKDKAADTTWQAVTGPEGHGTVRSSEVDSRASRIARASIVQYVQQIPPDAARRAAALKQYGLEAPQLVATIKTEGGAEYVVQIGTKLTDKSEYYATFSNSGFLVTVPDWVAASFEFDPAELFEPNPALLDPNKDKPNGDGEKKDEEKKDAEKKGEKKDGEK